MGYRRDVKIYGYNYSDLSKDDKELLIQESDVLGILDDAEDRVSKALKIINTIAGLTEIDNVKEILEELSQQLY